MMRWGLTALGMVAVGAVAVAAVGFGGASAQTPPEDVQDRTSVLGGERYRELLAEELGITVDELTAAQTAARDKMLDEAVAAGDLTAEEAERMKEMEPGEGPRIGIGGHMFGHAMGNVFGRVFETAAEVIGIPVEDLRERLANGESLIQIADGEGIDEATLKSDLIAALTDKINEGVANGDIEQERADALLEKLDDMVEKAINAEGHFEYSLDFGDDEGEGPIGRRLSEHFMERFGDN